MLTNVKLGGSIGYLSLLLAMHLWHFAKEVSMNKTKMILLIRRSWSPLCKILLLKQQIFTLIMTASQTLKLQVTLVVDTCMKFNQNRNGVKLYFQGYKLNKALNTTQKCVKI